MAHKILRDFVADESGGMILDWAAAAGGIVGIGLAATAGVQTGLLNYGTEPGSSFTDVISTGGPDVQVNTGKFVYTPIKTNSELFASYMYELADKSKEELSELYLQYMGAALELWKQGDYEATAANLDVAGAISEIMKDYRYDLPETEYKLQDFYGNLTSNGKANILADISEPGSTSKGGNGKDKDVKEVSEPVPTSKGGNGGEKDVKEVSELLPSGGAKSDQKIFK